MFAASIDHRRRQPEIMDQPGLDETRHRQALRALERINRLSFIAASFWSPLLRLSREIAPRPCRVLDVATGGGDVVRALARRARRTGVPLQLEGCDISPTALEYAGEMARAESADIRFFRRDVLADGVPSGYDAVITSLFLHHLDEDQAVRLLAQMAAATGRLVLVNDLERGPLGYLLAWLGSRLLTRSPVVHVDATLSVAGAFTCAEARALARRARLAGATVRRSWPCRYLLAYARPEASP